MNPELSEVRCPVCNTLLLLDNQHWIVTCSNCKKEIQIILYKGKVASVRQYISLSYPEKRLEIYLDYVKDILPLAKWGFKRSTQFSSGHIFDSESCRVKFELSLRDYFPLFATNIYYGRQHARDEEQYMDWNGKKCLCWHSNIDITLAFIEGIRAQELVDHAPEIWRSRVDILNVNYAPEGYLEYPLRLHAKIWEHYGERLFSIFDMRDPEQWEQYSAYSDEYRELINEYLHRKFDIPPGIESLC